MLDELQVFGEEVRGGRDEVGNVLLRKTRSQHCFFQTMSLGTEVGSRSGSESLLQ